MSKQESSDTTSGEQTKHANDKERSIAEWTTLGISLTIVIGIVALVTWLHLTGNKHPATIVVEPQMDQVRKEESGYYLPVLVRNEGGATVEDVQIVAELDMGSGEPETADFVVSFLSGGEEIDGMFVFQDDPGHGDLTTSAASFKVP